MGFLSNLLGATVQGTLGLGLGVVKDAVTLGGALTDEEPATVTAVKGAMDKTAQAVEDLAEGDFL